MKSEIEEPKQCVEKKEPQLHGSQEELSEEGTTTSDVRGILTLPKEDSLLQIEKINLKENENILLQKILRKLANGYMYSLGDGLPALRQCRTSSTGYIPPEEQHRSCAAEIEPGFYLYDVPEQVLEKPNYVWQIAKRSEIHYATESDVVMYVRNFLTDFIRALQIPYHWHSELGIQQITPDIAVISHNDRLVAVVKVKMPGPRILEQPTVMGELLDHLLLVGGFYSYGPVIGIITTFKEWRFAWFPEDNEHFCTDNRDFVVSKPVFITPKKEYMPLQRPQQRIPSDPNCQGHGIEEKEADDSSLTIPIRDNEERKLCTSAVLDNERDKDKLLQFIYTSFCRMRQVNFNDQKGSERCVFKFTRNKLAITWHFLSGSFDIKSVISSSKYPHRDIQRLLAIEDLGRGSSGKVWLTMTDSMPPAICVLKFSNSGKYLYQLEMEQKWWHELYPEFASLVHVERWSGVKALRMPHFTAIPTERRDEYCERIRRLLSEKFGTKYVHQDVAWRNIGMYRNSDDEEVPVLYDLETVREYSETKDIDWIDVTMKNLYNSD